jgi:cardiolipin synthase A/B
MDGGWLSITIVILAALQALTIFLALFEPTLPYTINKIPPHPLDSEYFLRILAMLTDGGVYRNTTVEALTNGDAFYEAQLEAIRNAKRSINLEAYIFQRGKLTKRFVAALTERARAGVKVNLVLDTIGSFTTWNSFFDELREAGGRVFWYHGFDWRTLSRINHRTHRELIVIDCEIGFVGGAGFADHWAFGRKRRPRWRDSVFCVRGEAVAGLQSTFVENWLEASGELLTAPAYYCFNQAEGTAPVLVVDSSASSGQSTRGRILFQTLMASARSSIDITTPYFLPDKGVRAELTRALANGVRVRILCPGSHHDHLVTRRSSRRLYGPLLEAGAEIYEYQPAMMHNKTMVVDNLWCVVGSTNIDHRSFTINDEFNLATCDASMASRLLEDLTADLAVSRRVTYQAWRKRPLFERIHEALGRLLERQQ